MIKSEIMGLVLAEVQRNDKTQTYHPRVIELTVENVLKEMYGEMYKANPHSIGKYTKTYGADTPIAVSFEASSGIYYSTLPAPVVNIPAKASGVIAIFPKVHTGNTFVPMTLWEGDMVFNTDVATVTKKIGFRVRQDNRVEYYNMNGVVQIAGVRMALLIPFSSYTDSEYVAIPELPSKEGAFLERVLTALSVIPPIDLLDNNASAPAQTTKSNQ